jgi:iron complex outermembrane receptor protein
MNQHTLNQRPLPTLPQAHTPSRLPSVFPWLFALFLLSASFVNAQSPTGTVSGIIKDETGNPMAGASVKESKTGKGASANDAGHYSLTLPAGTWQLVFTSIGHAPQTLTVTVTAGSATQQDIAMSPISTVQDILVVVGSRNPRRTATESPVPVDIIPLRQIANEVGQLDLTQLLTYLAPSFNSVRQALGDGTDHIDPAQLRGLGPDQVLVLLNGKRYHQSSLVNVNGTVNRGTVGTDLNSIPASSIDHVEILRDGASAQYGSDAIAGVINIVLKKRTGLTLSSSYGANVTSYDKNYSWNKLNPNNLLPGHDNLTDGHNVEASANYGIPLKKGYLELSAEYLHRGSSNRTGLYTGQLWGRVNGNDRSDSINAAKGLNRNNFDIRVGNSEIKGGGFVVNFGYPLSDNLELYVTGIANLKNGYTFGLYRYPYTISSGATGSSFPASNASSATAAATVLGLYPNGFLPAENSKVRDYSATAGVRGKAGAWRVDASETFGANTYTYLVGHSVNYTQAYVPGITPDQLQTSFNSGKTRLYQATTNLDFSRGHHVLEGLNTALGAEFRVDGYGIDAGEPNSYANLTTDNNLAGIAGAQVFAGFIPSNAGSWNRTSFSLYSDNELDITKKWLLSSALRYEHYSDFGSTLTHKVATRYRLTDWLSVRGATSSGFRAPSLQQEHYSKVTTQFVQVNSILTPVQAGTFTNDSKIAQILGIPTLKQETSISYSLGATAKITKGLDLTVDAYQIDINNRIILSNTFSGNNNSPAGMALTTALNNAGAATASVFANAINTRSRGIEGVLSYTKSWQGHQSITFSLAHSSLQNKVRRADDGKIIIHGSPVLINTGQLSKYFTRADESRIETYSPQTKDIFTVQYRKGSYGILIRTSYFGKVTSLADSTAGGNFSANAFDNNKVESLDQTFGGKFITDLSLSYTINKIVTINVGGDNLFDVYPDKQTHYGNTSSGRFTYSRAVSQFGFNGRYVYGRVTLNL